MTPGKKMLPDKKNRKDQDVNFFPESNSTELDAEPLVTDSEVTNSLRQELKAAINTMGPDTPHYFSDKFSEIEGSMEFSKSPGIDRRTYSVECKPAKAEIQELYKKELPPPSDESQSEIDIENVYTSNSSSNKSPGVIICPNVEPMPPLIKDLNDRRTIQKCHCNQKCYCRPTENFVPVQRSPIMQNRRVSRIDRHSITKWFRNRTSFTKKCENQDKQSADYYKMCVLQPEDDHSPPRRVIFNLVDELPKPKCTSIGVNTKPLVCEYAQQSKEDKNRNNQRAKNPLEEDESMKEYKTINRRNETIQRKIKGCYCGGPARVDVYYFDHGNASYLRTTDNPPLIRSEIIADQSEECNIKFWGEVFGSVHIGTSFVTSFVLQLLRFLLQSIIRPLTIGLLQITSDYFFKPCLATFFNAVIQPPLICIYNVCTSLRDICDPIAEGVGYFIREIAVIFKSCRFVDIRNSRPCEKTCYKNNSSTPGNHGEQAIIV